MLTGCQMKDSRDGFCQITMISPNLCVKFATGLMLLDILVWRHWRTMVTQPNTEKCKDSSVLIEVWTLLHPEVRLPSLLLLIKVIDLGLTPHPKNLHVALALLQSKLILVLMISNPNWHLIHLLMIPWRLKLDGHYIWFLTTTVRAILMILDHYLRWCLRTHKLQKHLDALGQS